MLNKNRIFMTVAFVLLTGMAHADNFTIGVEATNYQPMYNGKDGNYSGYARELMDAFGAKYGHQFTYKPLPVARLYDEFFVKKSLDFKFPDNAKWNAEIRKGLKVSYSKPLVSVTEGLLVAPSKKGQPIDLVKKIATLRGFTLHPYLDLIKANKIAVSEVNSTEAAISMTSRGRVDGAYLSVISANYIAGEIMKQPGAVVFDEKLPSITSEFSLSSIAYPQLVNQLDEFLTEEKRTVQKLKAKYRIPE